MSKRQRERAMRRAAMRPKGNSRPAGSEGYCDEYQLTAKGRAALQNIRDRVAAGVPVDQLGGHERVLLALASIMASEMVGQGGASCPI